MSDLQKQAINIINQMSEENLSVFVKFMQIFIKSFPILCTIDGGIYP